MSNLIDTMSPAERAIFEQCAKELDGLTITRDEAGAVSVMAITDEDGKVVEVVWLASEQVPAC